MDHMKFLKILIALIGVLLLARTVHAQIPSYPVYPNFQPYYPGATYPPYYPQAYYPQFYSPQAYYGQAPYGSDQLTNNTETIDRLQREVQQLTDQVRQLQAELSAQAQQFEAQAAPASQQSPEPPESAATPVILILKDGTRIESQGYAIANHMLWIPTPDGSQRIPLSELDVVATQKENGKRGIQFPNPGS
jgi:hypothetical protein